MSVVAPLVASSAAVPVLVGFLGENGPVRRWWASHWCWAEWCWLAARSRDDVAIEGHHHVVYVADGERPVPLPEDLRDQLISMVSTAAG